jgi:hypothetical protein
MDELWKDVIGYENIYRVSNTGLIISLRSGKFLRPFLNKKKGGYLIVGLHKNSTSITRTVHSLVAEAFVPNPDGKTQVNHKDCNKLNNHASNLEFVTVAENNQHALKNGRLAGRSGPLHAIITTDDVVLMRTLRYMYGVSVSEIERMFGLSRYSCYDILKYRTWKHC